MCLLAKYANVEPYVYEARVEGRYSDPSSSTVFMPRLWEQRLRTTFIFPKILLFIVHNFCNSRFIYGRIKWTFEIQLDIVG